MCNLFLDDIRNPEDVHRDSKLKWHIVRSYDEWVSFITNFYNEHRKLPDRLSMDHDLADSHYDPAIWRHGNHPPYDEYKEKTGYHCAKWLIDEGYDLRDVEIYIHSANPVGAENIRKLLENWNKFKEREEWETRNTHSCPICNTKAVIEENKEGNCEQCGNAYFWQEEYVPDAEPYMCLYWERYE